MEYLFSERRAYFNRDKDTNICAFCDATSKPDDANNLIVHRDAHCFVILNKYPYTSGHVMIVPYQHTSNLHELSTETLNELMQLVTRAMEALDRSYQPQGYNIGINIGAAGGAGIAEHLHVHVVPRWERDTNFITVLGGARVIPESLEASYKEIKKAWR